MSCPKCHSDDWKLASLIHKEGLSSSQSSTVGVGVTSGLSVGIGTANTSSTHQSELSKLTAPPSSFGKTTKCIIGLIFTGIAGFVASWWWVLTALFAVGVYFIYRIESKEDDEASARYKRTRMCTRCGHFHLGPQ